MTQLIDRQEVIKHIESCIDKNGYVDATKFSDSMRKIFDIPYKSEEQIRADIFEELKGLLRCRNYRGCVAGKGCNGVCSIDSDICKSCENFGIPYSLLAEWQKREEE